MDDIKVKKSNVLKAYNDALIGWNKAESAMLTSLLRGLFPSAFEEEKKESELRLILVDLVFHASSINAEENINIRVKQIIDLAKSKVDECVLHYNLSNGEYKQITKQKLDEM